MSREGRSRKRVFVSGDVQGVNFRAECAREARRLGLVGWVRNLPDGRVEAVFEGEEEPVGRMMQWCSKGPTHAGVEHVAAAEEPPQSSEDGFEVRR